MAIERLNLASAYDPVEAPIQIGRHSTAQSFVAGTTVLDVGCGEGYGARLLEMWGAKKVVAVDISGDSIAAARALYASDRVSFVQSDVLDLDAYVEGPFDVIVCFENIEHVKDPARLLGKIKAVSHPGAVSLIICPNDDYHGQGRSLNPHHLEKEFDQRRPSFAVLDGCSVSSGALNSLYTRSDVPPPLCITEVGVDLTEFRFGNRERSMASGRPLVIGWDGGRTSGLEGQKGSLRIIVQALQSEGLELVGHFADLQVVVRSASERRGYCHEIDLFVCTSELEGTPDPVLEAMACGVPIVAAPAGVAKDALGPKQLEFRLTERSSEGLACLLGCLANDRAMLGDLSQENLERIGSWSWSSKAPSWLALFSFAELRRDSLFHLRGVIFQRLLQTAGELDRAATKPSALKPQPRPPRAGNVRGPARPSRDGRVLATEVENKAFLAKLEVLIGHQKMIVDGVQQIARAQQRQASRPSLSRCVPNPLRWQ